MPIGGRMLHALRKHSLGRIVLVNIKHAIDADHVSRNLIAQYLKECSDRFNSDTTLGQNAPIQQILNMMQTVADIRQEYRFSNRPASANVPDKISTFVTWDVAAKLFSSIALNGLHVPRDESQVEERHLQRLEKASGDGKYFHLEADVYMGNARGFFWATPTKYVDTIRASFLPNGEKLADRIRNILGLVHYRASRRILEFMTSQEVLQKHKQALPTFIEAAGHARFKAVPCPGQPQDGWGRTADLEKAWPCQITDASINRSVEGLPERVVERIRFHPDLMWQWRSVGIVTGCPEGKTLSASKQTRDKEEEERNNCFAELIGKNPDWDELVRFLREFMQNHGKL
ncbi:MAG: hypothetical protein HQL65_12725 [Magnetococcales bacterium]|nr:hypothetical protein [Magnetococcales bacterium]